jgi:hypothetical protein
MVGGHEWFRRHKLRLPQEKYREFRGLVGDFCDKFITAAENPALKGLSA